MASYVKKWTFDTSKEVTSGYTASVSKSFTVSDLVAKGYSIDKVELELDIKSYGYDGSSAIFDINNLSVSSAGGAISDFEYVKREYGGTWNDPIHWVYTYESTIDPTSESAKYIFTKANTTNKLNIGFSATLHNPNPGAPGIIIGLTTVTVYYSDPVGIKLYDGNAWSSYTVNWYNGSEWVVCSAEYYDGMSWIRCSG